MFKFGIWRARDIERTRTVFATHRALAYSLLKTTDCADLTAVRRVEAVIKTVRLSSGSCRTTYGGRLAELDRQVQAILERLFPPERPIDVQDWGVSDGLVAAEWSSLLFSTYPSAKFTASDLILCFTEATRESGEIYVVEPDGTPIQYINPPFVVSLYHREHPIYPLNVAARAWGARAIRSLKSAAGGIRWEKVPDETTWTKPPWTFRQIPLIHPRALSFAREQPNFRITRHDAFTASPAKCDILRVMNLYNPRVFSGEKLFQGLQAAFDSIEEGGLFIVGLTTDGAEARSDASIFQKIGGRFSVIGESAKGSELRDMALKIRAQLSRKDAWNRTKN